MNFHQTHQTRMAKFGRGGVVLTANRAIDGVFGIPDERIQAQAPAVFSADRHDSRSDRYSFISTKEVLDGMRREGFQPVEIRVGGSKFEDRRSFTKHLIRFRRNDAPLVVGDVHREVVLLNSHDGSSTYRMLDGAFRTLCSNGLIVCLGNTADIKIPHKGDVVSKVIDAAFTVIDNGAEATRRIADMTTIDLKPAEQEAFAEAAAVLRFGEAPPIGVRDVNRANRVQDQGNDLWRTFNRAQENLIQRGGIGYYRTNEQNQVRHASTRPVQGVEDNTKLNMALWTLAARMQELKAA